MVSKQKKPLNLQDKEDNPETFCFSKAAGTSYGNDYFLGARETGCAWLRGWAVVSVVFRSFLVNRLDIPGYPLALGSRTIAESHQCGENTRSLGQDGHSKIMFNSPIEYLWSIASYQPGLAPHVPYCSPTQALRQEILGSAALEMRGWQCLPMKTIPPRSSILGVKKCFEQLMVPPVNKMNKQQIRVQASINTNSIIYYDNNNVYDNNDFEHFERKERSINMFLSLYVFVLQPYTYTVYPCYTTTSLQKQF